jgi:hypothetical protein
LNEDKYVEWLGIFNQLNEFLYNAHVLLNSEPYSYEEFNDLVIKTFGNGGVLEISTAPVYDCLIKIGLTDLLIEMMERYNIPERG